MQRFGEQEAAWRSKKVRSQLDGAPRGGLLVKHLWRRKVALASKPQGLSKLIVMVLDREIMGQVYSGIGN
jgi:hypothetical protein